MLSTTSCMHHIIPSYSQVPVYSKQMRKGSLGVKQSKTRIKLNRTERNCVVSTKWIELNCFERNRTESFRQTELNLISLTNWIGHWIKLNRFWLNCFWIEQNWTESVRKSELNWTESVQRTEVNWIGSANWIEMNWFEKLYWTESIRYIELKLIGSTNLIELNRFDKPNCFNLNGTSLLEQLGGWGVARVNAELAVILTAGSWTLSLRCYSPEGKDFMVVQLKKIIVNTLVKLTRARQESEASVLSRLGCGLYTNLANVRVNQSMFLFVSSCMCCGTAQLPTFMLLWNEEDALQSDVCSLLHPCRLPKTTQAASSCVWEVSL